MKSSGALRCAILGSGNIGTDLMVKVLRQGGPLQMGVLVGVDVDSDGLARARSMGVATTHLGIEGLLGDAAFDDVDVVFDATSAKAHLVHAPLLRERGKRVVDLTPAAVGPYVVPVVNGTAHADDANVNMVTCGGQATIPIVHAVKRASSVLPYAEIVASIASKSAGPGTRANIDEFTMTTSRGLEVVGGAAKGKAIIVLNPADPPVIMRDTVYCLCDGDEARIVESVRAIVEDVRRYVPGYRMLKQPVFESFARKPVVIPGYGSFAGVKVTVFLEVEGAADYLPKYAGNLDIMTSAALAVGEQFASK